MVSTRGICENYDQTFSNPTCSYEQNIIHVLQALLYHFGRVPIDFHACVTPVHIYNTSRNVASSQQFLFRLIFGLMSRMFTNGPSGLGSIGGPVIPKTKKMVLNAALFSTQYYKKLIKDKCSNPGNEVVPSLTPRCSSYWKGSLRVTLN